MKRLLLLLLCIAAMSGVALASGPGEVGQTSNVYTNGSEGLLAGTTPPPGTYLRWYNVYLATSTLRDSNGNNLPVGMQVGVFATVPRIVFVPKQRFLGANVTLSVLVPVTHIDVKNSAADYQQHSAHIGDVDATTALTWRKKHYDICGAIDWIFPTGAWDGTNPTKPGNNQYTIMPDFGFTYYFDERQRWNASVLARYEHHFKKLNQDVQMGDNFHFEWGFGHGLGKGVMLGPIGYAEWKVGDDSGSGVTWNPRIHDHVLAAGPEVMIPLSVLKSSLQVRGIMEFDARARTQGNGVVAILTKRF